MELLLNIISLVDTTGGRGGDTYSQQQSGNEYGTTGGTFGGAGQTGTGLGGTDTSGQYGDSDRFATGQTTGYSDPSSRGIPGTGPGRQTEGDDEYGASVGPGGPTGKQSMTSKVKGTILLIDTLELYFGTATNLGILGAAEQMTDKIMGDSGKQSRGREREVRSPLVR